MARAPIPKPTGPGRAIRGKTVFDRGPWANTPRFSLSSRELRAQISREIGPRTADLEELPSLKDPRPGTN